MTQPNIQELMDGVELSDVRIGSTQPTLFFVIHVKEPARVNIALQELNSAGRCMLVVSPTHTHPNVDTAVWQLTSPDPMKSVVINPVDENFVVGPLYIGIRYLEDSGSTFIRLRVDLQRSYTAVWFYRSVNPASQTVVRDKVQTILGSTRDKHSTFSNPGAQQNSLYVGEWEGAKHHGRGVCFYAMDAGAMSVLDARRSTLFAAVQQRRPLAWTAGTVIDDSAAPVLSPEKITGITSFDEASRWDMIQPIDENIEVYDGYWKDGMKHGKGVYQWADRVYVGEWQDGKRSGYGELVKADGSWYKGMWENDRKHGTGKTLLLPNGVVYDGNWVSGVKQGPGQLYYPDGTQVTGLWEKNKLQAPVRAVYKDGSSYEGGWDVDARSGEGALTDVEGRVHQHTWKANLREGEGTVRYATGVHYDGSWEDDKSTEGVFVFPNKDRYKGEWNHTTNVREGKGECRYANGDVYTGDWKNDLREGHGVLVTKDGKEYEGKWLNDVPHGRGVLKDEDGVYEGSFEAGVRSGDGVQRSADGSHYRGQWRHNVRSGPGVYYSVSEDTTYEGTFLQDRLVGQGKSKTASSNEAYEGTWLDGKQQGHGTHTLPNGDIIRGLWHRGKAQDGQVEFHSVKGGKYVGGWVDGKRAGKGTQIYPDQTIYEGNWVNDQRHGRGRLTKVDGETLECEWSADSVAEGTEGKVNFADGSVYEGQLKAGKPHGTGVLTYPDETVFKGQFENGVYML